MRAATSPGAFPWVPGLTLRQLLAQSQLPNQIDLYQTRIYRKTGQTITVDLQRLLENSPTEWNGPMQPDDLVAILPRPTMRIWVVGAVLRPGVYSLPEDADLSTALTRALGINNAVRVENYPMQITVRRGPETRTFQEGSLPNRTEFALESGDTIHVELPKLLRVTVGGEVVRPGEFLVGPDTTVADLVLANGAGPTQLGTARGVIVMRGNEVLVTDAVPPSPGTLGFALQSGDSVFVLRNTEEVVVLGRVKNPGRYLIEPEKPMFLSDALAQAGGLDPRGTLRRVYVLTREGDRMVTKQYNLDEFLKDGKLESNPKLKAGDAVLFGEPQGVTLQTLTQVLTTTLLLDNLINR